MPYKAFPVRSNLRLINCFYVGHAKKKKKKDVPFLTTDGEFLDVAVMS